MSKENKYCYDYPRPSLTVDCVVFGFDGLSIKVLLINRGVEPFKGKWALPGGFVRMEESIDEAAARELKEETSIHSIFLEQLYTFGAPERDPRGRVVSVAYFALINLHHFNAMAGDDAQKAQWFSLQDFPPLAFDHAEILRMAVYRLKGKIRYQPIGFELLPEKFTLVQLQNLYEAVLEMPLDKRNFRRKMLSTDLLIELNEKDMRSTRKKAQLYQFNQEKFNELSKKGFNFEI
jgi:8-oxo-dGTP diphosphatase